MRLTIATIIVLIIISDIIFYFLAKERCGKSVLKRDLWIFQSFIAVSTIVLTITAFQEFNNAEMSHYLSLLTLITILFIVPKLFFLAYSIVGILPFQIAGLFTGKKGKDSFIKKAVNTSFILGVSVSLLLFFILLYGGTIVKNRIITEESELYFEKLPKTFDNLKIAHFSDLHIGGFKNNPEFMERLVEKINEQNADIIIFSGDLINNQASEIDPYKDVLSNLKSKYGVFSTMGNHDYGPYYRWHSDKERKQNIDKVRFYQNYMGWNLLDNECKFVTNNTDSIAIIGVENWGEPPFSRYGDLEKAMGELNADYFSILISHNPVHWMAEVVGKTGISLTLSGHTHAMQLELDWGKHKFSPSSYIYREWGGIYKQNDQALNVNTGVGFVGFPIRIGATPEISVITLHSK